MILQALLQAYTDRINNFDKGINTLVNTVRIINPAAARAALQKDAQVRSTARAQIVLCGAA